MYSRKIYEELLRWKNESNGTSAILIEGARRIGKSTVAEEFAKNEYDDYLLIDFSVAENDILKNFDNINDMDEFFRILFVLTGKRLKERNAVIIFDEVQFFPKARQSVKRLVMDGRYDYIETGSLISIQENVKDILIPSEEESVRMYPMDFEEFLLACGKDLYVEIIHEAFRKRKALGNAVHRKLMQSYRAYIAVGGMPQAVEAYVEKKDFRAVDRVKKNILSLYMKDLKKFGNSDGINAIEVFKALPEQLVNHNSIFRLSTVSENARMRSYGRAISFLEESMIVNNCYNVTNPEPVLGLYEERSKFKMFMGDTGLLVSLIIQNGKENIDKMYKALIVDNLGINQGMIFENAIAQMLTAKGYGLYFHEFEYCPEGNESTKKYEVDFLITSGKRLVPIEVKSSNYKSHKSFDYFKEKYEIKMNDRYIIYTKDMFCDGDITYLPAYMTMCL